MSGSESEVTRLLHEWSEGDEAAFEAIIPLVYDDLSRVARNHMRRERAGHTLCTQALVHEAYLNLAGKPGILWRNRAQFFAVASRAMRRILIDHARRRSAARRGGAAEPLTWTDRVGSVERDLDELLAIDQALSSLAKRDARMARVVECRIFAGMNLDLTAEALGVSRRTVERDWTRAKAHLYRDLKKGGSEPRDDETP